MSRNPEILFDYECGRRPELAALASQIDTLTITEIEQAKLPLKWMRNVLLARKRQYDERMILARQTAALAEQIVDGVRPDPLGELRRWTGPTQFLRMARGSSIQVCTDNLLWLPLTGGVWIETVFSSRIDPAVEQATTSVGIVAKSRYIAIYRAATNRLIPSDTAALITRINAASPLAVYGVRFG